LPDMEKFLRSSSYSFTFRPASCMPKQPVYVSSRAASCSRDGGGGDKGLYTRLSDHLPLVTHQQLQGLLATDCDAAGDLLITADAEGTHSVAGLAVHRLLACQLLQHLYMITRAAAA
jgi:hypothetical protein